MKTKNEDWVLKLKLLMNKYCDFKENTKENFESVIIEFNTFVNEYIGEEIRKND